LGVPLSPTKKLAELLKQYLSKNVVIIFDVYIINIGGFNLFEKYWSKWFISTGGGMKINNVAIC